MIAWPRSLLDPGCVHFLFIMCRKCEVVEVIVKGRDGREGSGVQMRCSGCGGWEWEVGRGVAEVVLDGV